MTVSPCPGRRTALLGTVGLAAVETTLAGTASAQQPARQAPARPAVGTAGAPNAVAAPQSREGWTLRQVASFPDQVTGVAVTRGGRIFVNFPRWEKDVVISVAEVGPDGRLTPFPDTEWNGWRNRRPLGLGDHFVCVQSVTVDAQGALWIVDAAAPGNSFNKPGGPKLVRVDLSTNRVAQVIPFDEQVVPQGSYPNDVRVTPDGAWAILTDSGQRGALLVVEVASGRVRRVLDGHPSTQPDPAVVVHADGRELRRPDGRPTLFAADGIAMDAEGRYLYWQALTGRTLYRLPVASLIDAEVPPERLAAAVETVGVTGVADGLWIDRAGNILLTSPEDDSLKRRAPDGTMTTLVRDPRLRWPDSLAEGADGAIYVTASRIQDMTQYHEKGSPRDGQPYALFRAAPGRAG